MGEQRPHVLLVAFAAQGHLNPLLMFGKRLISKGLRVTLATTEVARERLLLAAKNTTTPSTTTNSETDVQFQFFSDGWDLNSEGKKNIDLYMEKLGIAGPQNLTVLLKNLANNGHPVSCIVNNPFVPWVVDVAEEHGIPCAMLWIQSCALYALYYRYYQGLNQFPDPTDANLVLELPGLPLLHREDLPSFLIPSTPFQCVCKILAEQFQKMNKVKWVLGNSFHDIERASIESMSGLKPMKTVGPLVPAALLGQSEKGESVGMDMWKACESCIEWLDSKPLQSVVYVSFGSFFVLSSKQMENLAWGLRDSGRLFLWVVRDGELPVGFLEETEGKGLVVNWCPQVKVLSHPSVGCFLTHCGWNSTLETVAAGVPVIAFPQWTDQPTNAKLLVDVFGMGLRLRGDEGDGFVVRKEEVERCVGEIMEGERSQELKMKAVEWKEAAGKATMEGGSSDRNIEDFVDEIIGVESQSPSALQV